MSHYYLIDCICMFVVLVLVEDRFVIDAVVKHGLKNDALLPDRLCIHALVDNIVVQYTVVPDMFVILALVDDRLVIDSVVTSI